MQPRPLLLSKHRPRGPPRLDEKPKQKTGGLGKDKQKQESQNTLRDKKKSAKIKCYHTPQNNQETYTYVYRSVSKRDCPCKSEFNQDTTGITDIVWMDNTVSRVQFPRHPSPLGKMLCSLPPRKGEEGI